MSKHSILAMDEVGYEPSMDEGFPGLERIADCDPEEPMTVAIIADAVWCGVVCGDVPASRMMEAERIGQITVGCGYMGDRDHETYIAYGPVEQIRAMKKWLDLGIEDGSFDHDDTWANWKDAARV